MKIHPTSIVDPQAKIAEDVEIGPFCEIGPKVTLASGVRIDSHVILRGRVSIGERTRIWPFVMVGGDPQDFKFAGEDTEVIIGKDNILREQVNISKGTAAGFERTVIGDGNYLMVGTHIGHDCIIGDHCVFANQTSLGGQIEIGNRVFFGGHVACHQFVKIGDLSMIGGGSLVSQDVAPYTIVNGNRASAAGVNVVGLRRAGIPKTSMDQIKRMYQITFRSNLTLSDARSKIDEDLEPSEYRNSFLDFLENSNRGVCRE